MVQPVGKKATKHFVKVKNVKKIILLYNSRKYIGATTTTKKQTNGELNIVRMKERFYVRTNCYEIQCMHEAFKVQKKNNQETQKKCIRIPDKALCTTRNILRAPVSRKM